MKKPNVIPASLDSAEWDFSSCPKEELDFCWRYEFAREQKKIIALVERRKKQMVGKWQVGDAGTEVLSDQRLVSFLMGFQGFPVTPWLRIDEGVRADRCSKGNCYFSPIISISPERILDYGTVPDDVDPLSFHKTYAIEIDWTASPRELIEAFKKFIAENGPKGNVHERKTGHNTPEERLVYLGAYRLMRFYKKSCADVRAAIKRHQDVVEELTLAPIYGTDAGWYRAHDNGLCLIEKGYVATREKQSSKKKALRHRELELARATASAEEAAKAEKDREEEKEFSKVWLSEWKKTRSQT